jgi:rod shape-determining protein MreC
MPQKFFSKQLITVIAFLAFLIFLVVWNPQNFFRPLREVFARTNYAFQSFFYTTGNNTASLFEFLGSIAKLKAENEDLIKENAFLAAQLAAVKDEKNENVILREQLKLTPKGKFILENALVISQDPQRLGSWIMIDKGSSAGIAIGMPVIVSDGILVGKVEEVSDYSAKISLLTNSASIVNAVDLNTEAKGIVKGEYGLGIILDLVSQADVLNEGDDIITSGLGGNYPRGLLIGRIQEFGFTADKLFQQAVIMPKVKYSELHMVAVIKN